MSFFRIIVPSYNNSEWLDKCLASITSQTFEDYSLVVVDDMSTDDSLSKAMNLLDGTKNAKLILNEEKMWNGGSRNVGLEYFADSKYTLFLDSDDWFADVNALQDLHDFIMDEECPDCVRLSYICEYDGNKSMNVQLTDCTLEGLTKSCFVACWTKCIKSDLMQRFPENTLMEDVVQHIKQCDVIEEVVPYSRMMLVHNRNNKNSITRESNTKYGKWQSSIYRYMADLLDLELAHDYCKNVRNARCEGCLKNIRNGVYSQSIIN